MNLGLMNAGTLHQALSSDSHSLVVLADARTLGASESQLYQQWLGPAEQAKVAAIKNPGTAANSILGRALARSMAGLWWGCSPQTVGMTESSSGKPQLCGPSPADNEAAASPLLHFSISHHRHWVAAVFALVPVGIDVEYPVESDRLKLARRFFLNQEYETLKALSGPDRNLYFTRLWTLKEAEVKRTGSALARVMGQVGFSIEAQQITRLGFPAVSNYQLYETEDAMQLALALSSRALPSTVFLRGHPLIGYQTITPASVAASLRITTD